MPRSREDRGYGGGPRADGGRVRAVLATLVLPFLLPLTPAAQQVRVEGRVVRPAAGPLAGQAVVLHRVTPGGGVLLAEAVTDSAGAFVLTSDQPAAPDAVYFVAARLDGQLYIGPMLRPPLPSGGYVLEVGEGAVPFNAGPASTAPPTQLPGAAAGTPRRWLLLLIPLLGFLGIAAFGLARSAGPRGDRRILIDIARLDNAWADAPDDRADYERRRRRLLDQLDAT